MTSDFYLQVIKMFTVYDLFDLHFIIVMVRSSPEDKENPEILSKVRDVISDYKKSQHHNVFRKALQTIPSLKGKAGYDFVFTENTYTYYPNGFLKDEEIYRLLYKALSELKNVTEEGNREKIYDLADCLHNLPVMIAENRYSVPKSFLKNEVSYYCKKWDSSFLK